MIPKQTAAHKAREQALDAQAQIHWLDGHLQDLVLSGDHATVEKVWKQLDRIVRQQKEQVYQ